MLPISFARTQVAELSRRLAQPHQLIQAVTGPRQSGKTTLVRQVLAEWGEKARYASADEPTLRDRAWLVAQWDAARILAVDSGKSGAVIALDEIQKISDWSETVKRLWDDDRANNVPLRVVLLGSAPLLVQKGLSETLAGRFEVVPVWHWSYEEMREAFGFEADDFIFHGGYPGSAHLIAEPERWARYIKDSLIETTISRDVLLLTRVDKPALLRRLFELGCRFSGQVLSYTKILGQLQDAGNTTTLAHYLDLLAAAGMLTGLQKYAGSAARRRGSSPKFQVLNTGLMTATLGLSRNEAESDSQFWGRLTESAVGAHLANAAAVGDCELFYWRDRNREVDFVARSGRRLLAIEVKSSARRNTLSGLEAFAAAFKPDRTLLVGPEGVPVEEFLSRPAIEWI
ncbi:MAG: ATP-binding protein [Rhodothermia bacterium]